MLTAERSRVLIRGLVLLAAALSCFACGASGQEVASLTPIYGFSGAADGDNPQGALIQGSDGNFYGATFGDSNQEGTIFKITPAGVLTTIYSFTGGADGLHPTGLTLGSDGNFYGATLEGGIGLGYGKIFKITPAGVLTALYAFTGGADGQAPGNLTQGRDGNFYGTTGSGGDSHGDGTIFKITPAGVLTTIYTFTFGADGRDPYPGLTLGKDGNFYGTTYGDPLDGVNGTVFKITPGGVLTTLHSFTGGADGGTPEALLTLGSDGNFYGTTGSGGGSNGDGTVFKITPAGILTTLYRFTGGADGAVPAARLTQASDGNFYGTTSGGGGYSGSGTVFEITPAGALTTLYTFTGGADGADPLAGLTLGSDGCFYGTAAGGGKDGLGDVFRLTVWPPSVTSGTASAQVDSAFSFQIVASNRPASFGASNLPHGLNVDAASGIISGTPTQSGTFTVGITATNSLGTGAGTLTLTVSPAPAPAPVLSSALSASGQAGQAFTYQITASNTPTSFGASGLPAGLSVDTGSGIISGTPTTAGTASVVLTATNSGGTGTATLALTINPASPVITSALTAIGQAGDAFTYQITASNTPTSFGASGLPAGLSVDAGTGIISGTPTVSGTFSVGLSAANAGGTGTSVLNLTLAPALPVVTLATKVSPAVLSSGKTGKFILSLPAPATADLVIKYKIKGTAINGVDYKLIKARQTIPAGATSKVIRIVPQGDLEGASIKTVTLLLKPEDGYTIGATGKAKVKILAAP